MFVVDNWHDFQTNSSIHDINIRYNNHLYIPSITPAAIQRGTTYSINIFNNLPPRISKLKTDQTVFKSALGKYILTLVFNSLEEFLSISPSFFLNLVINQLNAQILVCFIISLLYAFIRFEHYVLIIRRSKLYYTASGIITPVGGRPVHRLREECSSLSTHAPDGHLQV